MFHLNGYNAIGQYFFRRKSRINTIEYVLLIARNFEQDRYAEIMA